MPRKTSKKSKRLVEVVNMFWRIRIGTGYSEGFNAWAVCKPDEVVYNKPKTDVHGVRHQSIEVGPEMVPKNGTIHKLAMATSAKGSQVKWLGFDSKFYGLLPLTCRVPQDRKLYAEMMVTDD